MSTALDHRSELELARVRFESTPRELQDDELIRIARGDRGCLIDIISGLAAIAVVTTAILGAMGSLSFTFTYIAVGVWIGGFVWGTVTQSRSGKLRKAALEQGPLVLAVVLRCEDWLKRPGKRVGRAVVAFSTAPERRFDRDWLDALAAVLEANKSGAEAGAWAKLLTDEDAFGLEPIDAALVRELDEPGREACYLAAVHVHPDRLAGAYLGYLEDQDAAEQGLELDAPTRAPTIVAIVDPERGFIEQVPRTPGSRLGPAAQADEQVEG